MACRICCDQHRLALALVKPHGSIAWRAGYDEWGNVLWEENPESLAQLIRLPGQQYDEETGLYYNRHRYYDALLGRYITQDPIGWRGEWGLYTYPLNPLKYIDPLGLYIQNALGPFVSSPGVQAELTKSMAEYSEAAKPVSMRPDGTPWGYGCGDEKSDWYVPDGLFGADFMPACRTHDKCYGTLGSNKAYCDKQPRDNIVLACNKSLKGIPGLGETLSNCYAAAGIYQLTVERLGKDAYNAAQQEAK